MSEIIKEESVYKAMKLCNSDGQRLRIIILAWFMKRMEGQPVDKHEVGVYRDLVGVALGEVVQLSLVKERK